MGVIVYTLRHTDISANKMYSNMHVPSAGTNPEWSEAGSRFEDKMRLMSVDGTVKLKHVSY